MADSRKWLMESARTSSIGKASEKSRKGNENDANDNIRLIDMNYRAWGWIWKPFENVFFSTDLMIV